jgi:hypothetical protein
MHRYCISLFLCALRVLRGECPGADLPRAEALSRAFQMVDHQFSFNPILGSQRRRFGLGILARSGELDRLIGWYSR